MNKKEEIKENCEDINNETRKLKWNENYTKVIEEVKKK